VWLQGRDALINTDHLAMIFAEDQGGTWVVAGRTTVGERGGIVVVLAPDRPRAPAGSRAARSQAIEISATDSLEAHTASA
jgi:hypothetical protein